MTKVEYVNDELDRIKAGIDSLLQLCSSQGAGIHRTAIDPKALGPAAEAVALSLQVKPRGDGSVVVSVNNGRAFVLAAALADLMEVLAEDSGPREGGLVGWKTYPEIAGRLAEKTNASEPVKVRTIIQRAYRLRRQLAHQALNPDLIQNNRRRRVYRFALKTQNALK